MDLNLVVVCGRVAVMPEVRMVDAGSRTLRILVTVKCDEPRRRIDVLPVVVCDPSDELVDRGLDVGETVWIVGSLQRRIGDDLWGVSSRIEIVAQHVASRSVASARP